VFYRKNNNKTPVRKFCASVKKKPSLTTVMFCFSLLSATVKVVDSYRTTVNVVASNHANTKVIVSQHAAVKVVASYASDHITYLCCALMSVEDV